MSGAAIIKVGPLYFVMSRLPALSSQVEELILPEARQPAHGLRPRVSRGSADILHFRDRSYFALLIQPEFELNRADESQFITDVLRHAWDGLVGFGYVSGEMPEPIEGDPRKML